ncbi:MAG TPA: RpiB/LacA/LacB family sugar-phosphate isomerase, partial [bacterium]|nr:RpiB/LacA/LacB family sugar-phosphate isomerase [bacterium]
MKIAIASDHAGYDLKTQILEHLKTRGLADVKDLGPDNKNNSVDYPDYAKRVCEEVVSDEDCLGILV